MAENTILVSDEDIKRCRLFAEKSVSTSIDQYARRRQTDPRTIQHQIQVGKTGELGVFNWLTRHSLHPTEPDFEIYDARHKSFAADMLLEEPVTYSSGLVGKNVYDIHVKAQDMQSAERFGISWTFQYGTKVGSDSEIFKPDPTGYIAFALVNKNQVTLYGFTAVRTLHEYNLFRDPKLAKLRGIKTVVYNDDFQRDVPENQRWVIKELMP